MTLAIDARTPRARLWVLSGRTVVAQRAVHLTTPNALLPALERFLQHQRVSLKELRRIVVVDGPGMFSTLRASVSAAKTLAWILALPLGRVRAAATESPVEASALLHAIPVAARERFQPHYGRQPSITLKQLR